MHKHFLQILLLFLLSTFTTANAKVFLVSVGIADYPGEENDLTLPAKDAQTIAWLYGKNSDLTYRLLTNSDATADNIIRAINSVFANAKVDDIVVFFFSGHGYKGGFYAYDKALSYTKIRKAMARCNSKSKMIFADACYSGKIRTGSSSSSSAVSDAKKANVMLFLSSRDDEMSIERPSMKNGFFTTYLQKGLRGGADANRDRVITARELYEYVHSGVIEISSGRQHPVMWGRFPDNMPVMTWPQKTK